MILLQKFLQPGTGILRLTAPVSCQLCRRCSVSTVEVTQNGGNGANSQPREFCGSMKHIKNSPMKLNLVAKVIRRMKIADALAQVQFIEKKGATFVEQVLKHTQRVAVRKYDADPLDLWVAESFVGKGTYKKRIRYHGKGMHGVEHMYRAHYFLKLREGKPPSKKKSIEDTWKYQTRKFIKAGPKSIPNSL